MDERIYNRLALQYLADLRAVPQTQSEIAAHVSSRVRRPAGAHVERALATLETAGYAERCEAVVDAEPTYKITAAGLRQALRQVPRAQLDPLVWEG